MLKKKPFPNKTPQFCLIGVFLISWCLPNARAIIGNKTTLTSASPSASSANAKIRTVLRLYDDCTQATDGIVACLKRKAISFLERIYNVDVLTIADGVKFVRLPTAKALRSAFNENDFNSSLSRSSRDRDWKLTQMLMDRLRYYFEGHSLQVKLPPLTTTQVSRGLEEGRAKMKKMMSMLMIGVATKMMSMIPIAMGMLYILAGKALIVSKIALLLSGIMVIKKLMSSKGGSSGGGSSGGWPSGNGNGGGGYGWPSSGGGGGGGGGGWDRRSINEVAAQDIAYRSYSRPYQSQQKSQQLKQQQLKQMQHKQQKPKK
ncbi:uncharacterized protein LOC119634567 [Glossina fuscipes]|uniref:Uncharacterized protein LOC119634567 n=1 Tax=Glossina fuscipes TaxID=7396 RepID=A0A8U0WIW1_9MUSC|nr:uncharacterized protein LOC119634567 [Glossina fuscipes]KAI9584865.1 hypothetical protein GQX74_006760 [Glossina fuscipes]